MVEPLFLYEFFDKEKNQLSIEKLFENLDLAILAADSYALLEIKLKFLLGIKRLKIVPIQALDPKVEMLRI